MTIMMIVALASCFDHYAIPQSFAVSNLSVTTQRDEYSINDTVNISGSLFRPSEDEMTLKMYNMDAKLVWSDTIPIGIDDNEFSHTLTLSDSTWTNSGTYVILAGIDGSIASTKFSLNLEKRTQQSQNLITQEQQTGTTIPYVANYTVIDTDLLAQQLTEQLLSSSVFSQKQQHASIQLDTDLLAQQLTEQVWADQPAYSKYTYALSQENTNLAKENMELKTENRKLQDQNNILEESIFKLEATIDEQFRTIVDITRELAELKVVLSEVFGNN